MLEWFYRGFEVWVLMLPWYIEHWEEIQQLIGLDA